MGMPFDVFISYRHSQKDAVLAFCRQLQEAGITHFRDEERRDDAPSIQAAIQQGLASSRLFLAWYDETYLQSRACAWEFCRALLCAYSSGSGLQRIVCVDPDRKFDHIVPISLRDQAHVVSPGGGHVLVDELRKRLARFDTPFGEFRTSGLTNWFERGQPSHPTWVGRTTDLVNLVHHLEGGKLGMMGGKDAPVAITGWGGEGKTMLAEHYALSFAAAYPGGIVWLSGATEDGVTPRPGQWKDQLESGLAAAAAGKLALPVGELTRGIGEQDQRINILRHAIDDEIRQRVAGMPARPSLAEYLWIVDDLPQGLSNPADMALWTAPGDHAHTLATIREDEGVAALFHVHSISQLGVGDAQALLSRLREPQGEEEERVAGVIVDRLGRLPLALSLGALMVRRHGYARYLEMLDKYSSSQLDSLVEKLKPVLPTGHAHGIVSSFLRSLDQLPGAQDAASDDARAAWAVLRMAALLSPVALPDTLARRALECMGLGEDAEFLLDGVISTLPGLGLVKRGGECQDEFAMHALMARSVLEARLGDSERPRLMAALVEAAHEWVGAERQRPPAQVDRRAIQVANKLLEMDRLPDAVDLSIDAGVLAREVGDYPTSREILEHGLALQASPDTDDAIRIKYTLASTLHDLGELDRALVVLEQVAERIRRIRGEDHGDTCNVMSDLAMNHFYRGDLPVARTMQEQVLSAQRRLRGEDDPSSLSAMANLAATLAAQGGLQQARELEERVVAAKRRILGEGHRDTLMSMQNLAFTLYRLGDLAQAASLQRTTLEGLRELLGEEHPHLFTVMGNLALTLFGQGDWVRARALEEQTLAARRRILGESHPVTLTAMGNLAGALANAGDLAGAQSLYEQALAGERRVLGEQHPNTLRTMEHLAELMHDQGELEASLEMHERVVPIIRRTLGEGHPDTQTALYNLAAARMDVGDNAGARALYEDMLAQRQEQLGEEHPETLKILLNLAALTRQEGDLEGARQMLLPLLASYRRTKGNLHEEAVTTMALLAEVLMQAGDASGAQAVMQELANGLGEMTQEARRLQAQGDVDGAQSLFVQLLSMQRAALGHDHPLAMATQRELEQLFEGPAGGMSPGW